MTTVTINTERRLYVIPCAGGYSCLGFDNAEQRRAAVLAWLGLAVLPVTPGTLEHYAAYLDAMRRGAEHHARTRERCPAELTPALVPFEGQRVEVTYPDGTRNRFRVGKSTGWLPVHLELAQSRSTGGGAVYFPAGSTVRAVRP